MFFAIFRHVTYATLTRWFGILCCVSLCWHGALSEAWAASWQWSSQAGRERLELRFDKPVAAQSASRVAENEIAVTLDEPAAGFTSSGPAAGKLITSITPEGNTLRLHLRDAAFGYVLSKPAPDRLRVDVFPDPLGVRWKPSPGNGSLARTSPPAASTAVSAPAGSTTPSSSVTSAQSPVAAATGTATSSPNARATRQPAVNATLPATAATSGRGERAGNGAQTNATRPQSNATIPANPAATDARTLGSATRPDGRGLVVLPNGAASGGGAGVANGTTSKANGNGTRNGPPNGNGTGVTAGPTSQLVSADAATQPAPELPSVEELSRMTERIDRLPLNAVGGEQLRVPFAPLGAPPVVANATRAASSPQAPASSKTPAPVASAQSNGGSRPAGSSSFTETPLDEQGRPAASGVTGRLNMQGLSGGMATPNLGPSALAQQTQPLAGASVSGKMSTASTPQSSASSPSATPSSVSTAPAPVAGAAEGSAKTPDALVSSSASAVAAAAPIAPVVPEPANTARVRGRLNSSGPDAWPQERWLDAGPAAEPEPVLSATSESAAAQQPPATPPRVIYVDEKGNEVPKPPDSVAMIEEAQKLLNTLQYQTARDMLENIKTHVLTQEQREQVLYMLSDAYYGLYPGKWLQGYEPISISTNEAMNFNLKSQRVPDALYRLGMLNLDVGNQQDAIGYFNALKAKYPNYPGVPQALYRLGKDQLDRQQYAEAVRTFQSILDEYPENKIVRDASRYMAEALYKQGHYERALILVDFVDRRWPRIYLEDPSYLLMVGDLQLRMHRYPEALQTLWTYYNLLPDTPDNHKILLEIGTIYLRSDLDKGARDVFDELLRKYPKSTSAPTAILRMGEMGVSPPNPTLKELTELFERPGFTLPETAYRRILSEYPDAPEAEMAALRLVAWQFWNRETAEAMAAAAAFLEKYPSSPKTARAEEIIRLGFERERALALAEENYERILRLWETYPQVRVPEDKLDDDLRVALARAHLNRGAESEGMALLEPFLKRPKDPKYGEYVYNLKLAKLLREENWSGIIDLGEQIASWSMPQPLRNQLDYSLAISAENLGLPQKALPIWKNLYKRTDIPLYQKAYATYFMARDAERRKDLKDAYDLNLETLKLFTQLEDERSDKADPERVRESIAALMDVTEVANRFAEALDWTQQYSRFVNEDSPDYSGLRFRQARLHRKMGDLARWRNLLEDIVRREPESVFGRMATSELRTQEVARDLTRFAP